MDRHDVVITRTIMVTTLLIERMLARGLLDERDIEAMLVDLHEIVRETNAPAETQAELNADLVAWARRFLTTRPTLTLVK